VDKTVGAGLAIVAVPLAAALGLVMMVTTTGAADTPVTAVGTELRPGSVPAQYAPWIEKASGACDLDLPAPLLAAQLNQESGFDPNAVSPAGAEGIAQFMPSTWPTWSQNDDGTGNVSEFNPYDSIMAQGRYMCSLLHDATSSGYPGGNLQLALAGYNAGWGAVASAHGIPNIPQTQNYVAAIMAAEANYEVTPSSTAPTGTLPPGFSLPPSTPASVATAITWALDQRGGWYQYGGDCTAPLGNAPMHWCDCSSLVQQAYAQAGISLPRTTYGQVLEGQPIDPDDPMPGDLVFVPGSDGTPSNPGHVGIYVGDGLIINAPRTGEQIQLASYSSWRNASAVEDRIVAVRRIVNQ
jgi:cell wall-associated NlpC family hydrolase